MTTGSSLARNPHPRSHRKSSRPWREPLVALSRYASIVWFKTYANVKRDIDKTYLGTIWWVLEPLISTAVYYVIFSYVMKNKTPNFILFLLVGNVIYGYFSSSINGGANAILGNAGLMQQVQLPKALYPIIAICNLTWKFLCSMVVIFLLLWMLHAPLSIAYVALPVLLVFQVFIVIAISLPLSILIPYFQDGRTLLSTFLGVGVWFSGVFFSTDRISREWLPLFYLNPVAPLIEGYRAILVNGKWPEWRHFGEALPLSLLLAILGFFLIGKLGGKVTKLPL